MIAILPKLICRFNVVPNRIPPGFLVAIYKLTLKFIWKLKEFTIAKTILKMNKKLENSHFPISKLTTKRQSPRWCGAGLRTDTEVKEIELGIQKPACVSAVNWP